MGNREELGDTMKLPSNNLQNLKHSMTYSGLNSSKVNAIKKKKKKEVGWMGKKFFWINKMVRACNS